MRVQLLERCSGNPRGTVITLDRASAVWLIEHGRAVEVPEARPANVEHDAEVARRRRTRDGDTPE